MTIRYKHDPESQFMLCLISQSLTLKEIGDHISATIGLNDSEKPWLELADCRTVTDVSGLNGTGLRSIAAMEKQGQWHEGSRSAIVVRTPLHYGLARIFTAVASRADKNLKVFYELEEAIRWLGLDAQKQNILQIHAELERDEA